LAETEINQNREKLATIGLLLKIFDLDIFVFKIDILTSEEMGKLAKNCVRSG